MTGHKTRSVFERYNIVSAGDLRDAATRLEAVRGTGLGQGLRTGLGVTRTTSGTIDENPA
jgi:hypothetical protein